MINEQSKVEFTNVNNHIVMCVGEGREREFKKGYFCLLFGDRTVVRIKDGFSNVHVLSVST